MSSTLISELNCAPNFEAGQKLIFISQVERGLPICLCRMKQIRGETRCDPNRRLKGKVRPPRAWKGTDNIFNVQCNKCLYYFRYYFLLFGARSPFYMAFALVFSGSVEDRRGFTHKKVFCYSGTIIWTVGVDYEESVVHLNSWYVALSNL